MGSQYPGRVWCIGFISMSIGEVVTPVLPLQEQVRQLQSMLPSASRRPEAAAAAGALPPPSPIREPTEPPAAAS